MKITPEAQHPIYQHSDTVSFLNDYVSRKRLENPNFSLNSWSKKIGISTSGILVNILKGRRKIPIKRAPKMADTMGLTGQEKEYFCTLVALDHAQGKGIEEIERCRKIAKQLTRQTRIITLNESESALFSRFSTVFVRETLSLLGAPSTMEEIHAALQVPADIKQVRDAVTALVTLGLVQLHSDERVELLYPSALQTPDGVRSVDIRKFHKDALDYAASTLETVPLEERYFSSFTASIDSRRMSEATASIDRFQKEFLSQFGSDHDEGDRVYQLNINFVPISKRIP